MKIPELEFCPIFEQNWKKIPTQVSSDRCHFLGTESFLMIFGGIAGDILTFSKSSKKSTKLPLGSEIQHPTQVQVGNYFEKKQYF